MSEKSYSVAQVIEIPETERGAFKVQVWYKLIMEWAAEGGNKK